MSWIDKDKLTGLVYSRLWAAKQGKSPTREQRDRRAGELKNVEAMSPTEVAPDASARVPALRTAGFNLASISESV